MRSKLLAVLSTLAAVVALAQGPAEAPTLQVKVPKKTVAAGGVLKAELLLTFAEGLHGYQNPPSEDYMIPVVVKVDSKEFKLAKVAYPKGIDMSVGGTEKPAKVYGGQVKIPIELKAPAKLGKNKVKVVVSYQQCDDKSCFPPDQVTALIDVEVVKAPKK